MKKIIDVCRAYDIDFKNDVTFKNITTLKVGGAINLFVEPDNLKKLEALMSVIWEEKVKYKVLGFGSNILASDNLFDGVVIRLKGDYGQIYALQNQVEVGAAVPLAKIIKILASIGNSGLEFASGIPATIGGAVFGNCGANGDEIASYINEVHILTKDGIQKIMVEDMKYKYRSSILKEGKIKDFIILKAFFKFKIDSTQNINLRIQNFQEKRVVSQPKGINSAGSFFKNNSNQSAWSLIDKCGLRGYNVGDAKVNEKHTNFLVNMGSASADDFLKLATHIKDEVKKKFDVVLEEEVEYFNFDK